jgi:hypothetical protein
MHALILKRTHQVEEQNAYCHLRGCGWHMHLPYQVLRVVSLLYEPRPIASSSVRAQACIDNNSSTAAKNANETLAVFLCKMQKALKRVQHC